jgi:hypothetical protein
LLEAALNNPLLEQGSAHAVDASHLYGPVFNAELANGCSRLPSGFLNGGRNHRVQNAMTSLASRLVSIAVVANCSAAANTFWVDVPVIARVTKDFVEVAAIASNAASKGRLV